MTLRGPVRRSLPQRWSAAPPHGSRPLVLGHRGASAEAPENTLAAFRLAMQQGADGVELDVQRCATGEVVVLHDEDLRRVAGQALRVRRASLAGLRSLDVGVWKSARYRGERVPLLSEVLEELRGAIVNVELKGPGGDLGLAAAAARVIRGAGASERVIVSSFHAGLLAAFRAAAPEVPRGLLFDRRWLWQPRVALAARALRVAAVHPEARLVTAARTARWQDRGLAVVVWTADDPEEVRRLGGLGAAALITNVPGRAREALASRPHEAGPTTIAG